MSQTFSTLKDFSAFMSGNSILIFNVNGKIALSSDFLNKNYSTLAMVPHVQHMVNKNMDHVLCDLCNSFHLYFQ